MRLNIFVLLFLATVFSVSADNIIFKEAFSSAESVKKYTAWNLRPELITNQDASVCMKLQVAERTEHANLKITFQPVQMAGKWIEVSANIKGENVAPAKASFNGAKFMLPVQCTSSTTYFGASMKSGSFDWERVSFKAVIPEDARKIELILGFQDSFGTLLVKDLKIEEIGVPLNLSKLANMGLSDKTSSDGKGGWSDQGPDNDASNFKYHKDNLYAGIPFRLIKPDENGGKAVLSMKSAKFPAGLESAELKSAYPVNCSYLYILHTVCHGAPGNAGFIEVTGKDGASQTIPVELGRDVSDWWNPKRSANACPAAQWQNASGGTVGIYASKFRLDPGISPVVSVKFRGINGVPVWIILGATLSENNYEFPDIVQVTTKANDRWKAMPTVPPYVLSGSALDRSQLTENIDITERVITNKNGQLALSGKPEIPVRFLCVADSYHTIFGLFKSKKDIEDYTRQLRMQGYNMARLHYFDDMLMKDAKKPLEFNQDVLDRFDYYVFCMKKNGIYLNLDAMCSPCGYEPGYAWAKDKYGRDYGFDIYFLEKSRENWRQGVRQLLTHINPYTGTALVDDPVLAIVNGKNEQEFAMMEWKYPANAQYMIPSWREFIKRRYKSLDAYNNAWKLNIKSWEEVPLFTAEESRERGTKGTDVVLYKSELEGNQYKWYVDELRKIGYTGIVTNYDMGQSLRYIALRKDFQAVGIHSYHAHPSSSGLKEETIDQSSAIANSNAMFRGINSTRLSGKALLTTEYGVVFWNKYRYEEAFTMGAYSAFQDHSALTVHSQTVSIRPEQIIKPFGCTADPVIHASEFLTAYLFRRGDVAPAKVKVRLDLDSKAMFANGSFNEGIHYGQSRLCLLTGASCAVDPDFPVQKNELSLSTAGGSTIMTRPGYTMVVDQPGAPFDIDKLMTEFKKQGLVPENNRTSAVNEIFENSNNEIYLDARKHFMSVNTPKLQGICSEAGQAPVALKDLTVSDLSVRGNVAAVSIDDKALADSKRIVLVYATNALNSDMVFLSEDMRVLKDFGKAPILVECGSFSFKLNNRNAAKLKLYALNTDGSRRFEIPLQKKAETVQASINTVSMENGPSIYFELAAE